MDFLESIGLDDLPEQQTRTVCLTESDPEFQLHLGFNACCACGKANPDVECKGCNRVKYCSEVCREKDKAPPDDEQEQALGHSSIICSLLGLCNDDERVEETRAKGLDKSKRDAALDRIVSEFESYPATLANIINEGPCYANVLGNSKGGTLTLHVIGASSDSELWLGHPDKNQGQKVFECYADALSEMAETKKIKSIRLCFIGPECPKAAIDETIAIPAMSSNDGKRPKPRLLHVSTHRGLYQKRMLEKDAIPSPDIIVLFNPGFTCPDYEWSSTLRVISPGTPFLTTTNTELEGIADFQFLLDNKFVGEASPGLAEVLGRDGEDKISTCNDAFFSLNPFAGSRVHQSGTMANDLYVKSHWITGGYLSGPMGGVRKEERSAKRRKTKGGGNSKSSNPALI